MSAGSLLSTRTAGLRAVSSADHDWLYQLLIVEAGGRWRYRGRTPSPAEFSHDLWQGVHAQFVVVDAEDRPSGLVGTYNLNIQAGHCHLFAVGAKDRGFVVVEAAGLLVSWAFDEHELRKIWIEVPEFNLRQFASLTDVAEVEGRLTGFDYWQGRYWDTLILSLTRQRWDERHRGVVERRRRSLGASDVEKTALPSAGELSALLRDFMPLDSLGAIEVMTRLEERLDAELDIGLLDGLGFIGPDDAAAVVLDRLAARSRTRQQPVGVTGGLDGNGHDPSTVAEMMMSCGEVASTLTTFQEE